MKCPKCGYESTEPDTEENEKSSINMLIVLALVAIALALAGTANYLDTKDDKISYSGGGHMVGGTSDDDIVVFFSDDVWHMIIPDTEPYVDVTTNTTENSTTYNTYYWNDTGWVLK